MDLGPSWPASGWRKRHGTVGQTMAWISAPMHRKNLRKRERESLQFLRSMSSSSSSALIGKALFAATAEGRDAAPSALTILCQIETANIPHSHLSDKGIADSFASSVNTVFSICDTIFDLGGRSPDAARLDLDDSDDVAFMRSF